MAQASVLERADTIMTRIESESPGALDQVQQFLRNQEKALLEAQKIVDPVERKAKFDVLTAQFKKVREEAEADKTDLAAVVGAFLASEQTLDAEIDLLENATPEEKSILDEAETALTLAKGDAERAKKKRTWFGLADPVGSARVALERAEAALKEAQGKVQKAMRERIMHASPEQSITTLQLRGERTLRALDSNKQILIIQLGVASKGREESYKLAADMDVRVRSLDSELEQLDAKINQNVERLERLQEDSPDSIALQSATAELRRQFESKRNEHTAAMGVKNEATKDALEYGGQETALQQTIGAIDTMMHVTEVKNREMPKKRETYTKILRGGAIQEISKNLADVGDAAQLRMMKTTVRIGQAAVNSRQDYFGSQPGRIAERKDVRLSQEAARVASLKRDEDIRAEFITAGVDIERIFKGESNVPSGEAPASA